METEILSVDPVSPNLELIEQAAEFLRRGEVVAFPTETVYGLGANALNSEAVVRIFQAKGRPANNPLIVHVAAIGEARRIVSAWPEAAQALAERFWPGPLTLVLAKANVIPANVTGGGPTVAVRVPAHPVALALLRAAGFPVAAPSANRSSELSPTKAEHVVRSLDGRIRLILDGGPTQVGLESTVLDLSQPKPRLLRPGSITRVQLEAVIGPIGLLATSDIRQSATLPSPGLLTRHYSPRTPIECVEGDGRILVEQWRQRRYRVAWLTIGRYPDPVGAGASVLVMPSEPELYAAALYDTLHQLDQAGLDRIVVDLPPATDAWLAVRDRLLRAAATE